MNKRILKNKSDVFKILMIVYLVIMAVLFASYYYADFREVSCVGINFWDILFRGDLLHFYDQDFIYDGIQFFPNYNILMYMIFAVWNLPTWIVTKVSNVDVYNSTLCLLWMKSITLIWTAAFMWTFTRLIKVCIKESSKEGSIDRESYEDIMFCDPVRTGAALFLSSAFYMSAVVICGQYDIISMTFVMQGILHYITEDKIKRGYNVFFILYFAIALPLKMFALLVFIPLLLLKEKRVYKIVVNGILVYLPTLLLNKVFPVKYVINPEVAEGLTLSSANSYDMSLLPLYVDLYDFINIGFGVLFLYVFAEVILLIICYMFDLNKSDSKIKWIIYVCFMTYFNQFVLAYSHPYWLLMIVPFIVIMILLNRKYMYINILIDTVMCLGMLLAQMFFFTWAYTGEIVMRSFWRYITGSKHEFVSLTEFSARFVADDRLQTYATGIGLTIFTAGMLVFAVINCPPIYKRLKIVDYEEKVTTWLFPARLLGCLVFGMIPLVLYFLV
ncbi:hypothetical protein [Butyrivibrio sp. TB]|uniref:hypothetical protein n=1 Tax=Butyrivibrio sp. TB TaxID=1520809 RepID=UPI0008ADF166|nr:hypothetical protein [Butyrivibrio sp. TB]SEQ36393.1 hypothetical protein SAMN02910382_02774 [Butyrivibrio sp. TB]